VIFLLPHAKEMGTESWAEPLQPDPVPIPSRFGLWREWFGPEAKTQAICTFNQAAVLMVLISLAVMKAAPPP
jgi:hypothetical protein